MDETKTEWREYELTLTNTSTGEKVTVTLAEGIDKWKVAAEGYHGYFKDLATAYIEACRHIKTKQKE